MEVVITYQDYYPFGSTMPGRTFNGGDYRFGFNGMEKDDDIDGVSGSKLDFGARIYDSRIGKFLSIDPLYKKYSSWTPYSFVNNNPILFLDADGKEPTKNGAIGVKAFIELVNSKYINSLSDLFGDFGGSYNGSNSNKTFAKYLYSPKWGWIDTKHFSSAANRTDWVHLTGNGTLEKGEMNENSHRGSATGWDYEDLVSNLIGVYFEEYLESDEASGKSFSENLESYLTELGFTDNVESAPNFNSLPETIHTSTNQKNTTYDPFYVSEERNGSLDLKVLDYLNDYLQGQDKNRSYQFGSENRVESTNSNNDINNSKEVGPRMEDGTF